MKHPPPPPSLPMQVAPLTNTAKTTTNHWSPRSSMGFAQIDVLSSFMDPVSFFLTGFNEPSIGPCQQRRKAPSVNKCGAQRVSECDTHGRKSFIGPHVRLVCPCVGYTCVKVSIWGMASMELSNKSVKCCELWPAQQGLYCKAPLAQEYRK